MVSRFEPDWGIILPDRCSFVVDSGERTRPVPDRAVANLSSKTRYYRNLKHLRPTRTLSKYALKVTVPKSMPSSVNNISQRLHIE